MKTVDPGSYKALMLQFAALFTGIAILILNRYQYRGPAVTASGIFFINLFWVTMILGHDLPVWALLRNTMAGGIFLIGVILVNLLVILILALIK